MMRLLPFLLLLPALALPTVAATHPAPCLHEADRAAYFIVPEMMHVGILTSLHFFADRTLPCIIPVCGYHPACVFVVEFLRHG